MRPVKYSPEWFEPMDLTNTLTGKVYNGMFTDRRIVISNVPEGKFVYNCRHGDDGDLTTPVTIEKGTVLVNFAGTFVTDMPIDFPASDCDERPFIPVEVSNWG